MLIKIGNCIANTSNMIDARFTEKGERASLLLRYAVSTRTGEVLKIKLVDDNARGVWALLSAEAEDLPYTGDD